ncbi:hypothetical protein SprV_0100001100 [Sparganum proliferum]
MLSLFLCLLFVCQFIYGGENNELCLQNFTASALNSSSIRATWERTSRCYNHSNRFQITISNVSYTHVRNVSETSAIFTNLTSSTIYTLTLQALSSSDEPIGRSLTTYAQTWPDEGLMPGGFAATNLNSSSIFVNWTKPILFSKLDVNYKLTIYDGSTVDVRTVSETSVVITSLQPSTAYNLKVVAVSKDGKPVGIAASTDITTLPLGVTHP